jgi:hypothetical protein
MKAEELPIKSLPQDFEAKTMVHFILAEMCGNRLLEALVKSLMGMTTRFVAAVQPDVKSMHPAGMHNPIVKAVLAGNGDAAAEAMELHTEEFGRFSWRREFVRGRFGRCLRGRARHTVFDSFCLPLYSKKTFRFSLTSLFGPGPAL